MTTTSKTVTLSKTDYSLLQSFLKHTGESQEGKNDYTVGCIQSANAFSKLIVALVSSGIEVKEAQ